MCKGARLSKIQGCIFFELGFFNWAPGSRGHGLDFDVWSLAHGVEHIANLWIGCRGGLQESHVKVWRC